MERGSPKIPAVALTFDDGPNPNHTPVVLRILEEHQIRATFFCIGSRIRRFPDLLMRVANAGHLIGNHTYRHLDLSKASKREIFKEVFQTSSLLEELHLNRSAYFRFPYARHSFRALQLVDQMGLINVAWSVDCRDWLKPGVEQIVNRANSQAHNGAIILLHDGGIDRSQTLEALPIIISNLKSRGFAFQRIDEMRVMLNAPV